MTEMLPKNTLANDGCSSSTKTGMGIVSYDSFIKAPYF
jgi:hypothetical protein